MPYGYYQRGPCKNLTGRKFGRLTVIGFEGELATTQKGVRVWICRCDCGNIKRVSGKNIYRATSCGCRFKEFLANLARERMAKARAAKHAKKAKAKEVIAPIKFKPEREPKPLVQLSQEVKVLPYAPLEFQSWDPKGAFKSCPSPAMPDKSWSMLAKPISEETWKAISFGTRTKKKTFSKEDKLEMRKLYDSGEKFAHIAERYATNIPTILPLILVVGANRRIPRVGSTLFGVVIDGPIRTGSIQIVD
jgi:hypothetical protein